MRYCIAISSMVNVEGWYPTALAVMVQFPREAMQQSTGSLHLIFF